MKYKGEDNYFKGFAGGECGSLVFRSVKRLPATLDLLRCRKDKMMQSTGKLSLSVSI